MEKKNDPQKEIRHLTTDASLRLSIRNYESRFVHLLDLHTPFMIILETCQEDRKLYSFYQLSPDGHSRHILGAQEQHEFLRRPLHQHDFTEIMYVVSGELTNHIENQTFTYHAGDCVIMNRNIRHKEDLSGNFEVVYLDFQKDFVDSLVAEETRAFQELPSAYRHYTQSPIIRMLRDTQDDAQYQKIYFDCLPAVSAETVTEKTIPLLDAIFSALSEKTPGSLCLTKGFFQKFLSVLCDPELYHVTCISSTLSKQDFLLTKIRHIVESRHGRVSRRELAAQLHYNEDYLNRMIKQNTGMSFSRYRRHIMLLEAQKLLADSDRNVSQIIEYLGVSNRSYFYRIFQNTFGMKPLEYRRRHQQSRKADDDPPTGQTRGRPQPKNNA